MICKCMDGNSSRTGSTVKRTSYRIMNQYLIGIDWKFDKMPEK